MKKKIKNIIERFRIGKSTIILMLIPLAVGVAVGALMFSGNKESQEHASHDHAPAAESKETIWTCSMHPQVRQPDPGLCPLCAMDLIPLVDDGDEPGPKTVKMSERAKALARIVTTPVKRQRVAATDLRLLGRIEANETAEKSVTAWTGGRIDRLHVRTTGQKIRAGQTIATLYSPEVFSAHQDLLVAKKQVEKMSGSTDAAKSAAQRALEASRTRLRLLGVPTNVLENLEQQSEPTTRVAIRSPFAGTVTERVATEGAYVNTGAQLYKVVNLSKVWVQLDAYESDLPTISVGQDVEIEVEGISGEIFVGKVTFIDPTLDPTRRVARVRVEVDNKDGQLRPGMFVEAEVKSPLKEGAQPPLVIPETAPLFTGHRAIVFVEDTKAERPTYTARTVRLGLKTGEEYPVIAGLSEGEQVVTKGAFTLDADLQIRGGSSMMTEPDDSTGAAADAIIQITAQERKKLSSVFKAYLELQKQLAADEFDKSKDAAETLAKESKKAKIKGPKAAADFWKEKRQHLQKHATELSSAKSIEEARGVFEMLSKQIISMLERLGNPLDVSVRLAFCPMAMGSKGAHWVQQGDVVDNSYYGDAMRTCGEIKNTVDAGSYLLTEDAAATPAAAPAGGHQH